MISPRFFSAVKKTANSPEAVRCVLCPRRCVLPPGKAGRCGVRFNRNGKPDIPFYGYVTGLALDPIEKKPLYHYRPGTEILSAGFTGCNLRCPFCQNWRISQNTEAAGRFFSPTELVRAALKAAGEPEFPAGAGFSRAAATSIFPAARPKPAVGDFPAGAPGFSRAAGRGSLASEGESSPAARFSIAYTYSEPLVHAEFLLDCMTEARKAGGANVLVSNGCVNSEAAAEILELCDAANIDLKCFSAETYREVLGGSLSAVLDFIRAALERGVHLELTTLVVPGLNDSGAELGRCRDFIAELETGGKTVPWHLSAYRPEWKWRAPATESGFLAGAVRRAREKVSFVYSGNLPSEENFNDTLCPHCGKILVGRRFYTSDTSGLSLWNEGGKPAYFCASCGKKAPIR